MNNEIEYYFKEYKDSYNRYCKASNEMMESLTDAIKPFIDSQEDIKICMKNGICLIAKIVAVDVADLMIVFKDSTEKTRVIECWQLDLTGDVTASQVLQYENDHFKLSLNVYDINKLREVDVEQFFSWNPETVYIGKEYETMRDL